MTLTARAAQRRYLALSALRWFTVGLVFPVQLLLYADRGLSLGATGWLIALYSATVIALELPTGGLADRLGRRATMLLSCAASAASFTGLALAQSWWQFAAASVLSAIARALGTGPLEAWYVDAARATDPAASLRTGISRGWAVEALGLGVAATLGGWLPRAFDGAHGGLLSPFSVPALVAAGLAAVSLAAHAVLMVEPARRSGAGGAARALRGVPGQIAAGVRLAAGDPVLRLLALRVVAVGFAVGTLEVLTPHQLAGLLGGADDAVAAYGMLATAAWLGSAAGSAAAPMASRLGGRSGPLGAAAWGTALTGAAVALIGLAAAGPGGFALAAAGYVVAYVAIGVPGPLAAEAMHERVGAAGRATLVSVSSLGFQLGALTGVLVATRLAELAGFPSAWLAAAGALGAAAALTAGAARAAAVPVAASRSAAAAPVA